MTQQASAPTFRRSATDTYLAGLHESGHAVIGWLFGLLIKYVTIIPDETWGGYCHLTNCCNYFYYFVVLRAGKLAERIVDADRDVCYGPGEWGEGSDARMLFEAGEVLTEDKTDLINGMEPFDALYLEVNELLTDLIDFEPIRDAIIALANELVVRQELSGQEAEAIIEPILGPVPWFHDERKMGSSL